MALLTNKRFQRKFNVPYTVLGINPIQNHHLQGQLTANPHFNSPYRTSRIENLKSLKLKNYF